MLVGTATHQNALGATLRVEDDSWAVPIINTYGPPPPLRSGCSRSGTTGIALDLGRRAIVERRVKAPEIVEP